MCVTNYGAQASGSYTFGPTCSPKLQMRVWRGQGLQVAILCGTDLQLSKIIVIISNPSSFPKEH